MRTSAFAFITALLLTASSAGQTTAPAGEVQTPDPAAGYAWARACKDCHQAEFASWERSKHARALERLGKDEQGPNCLGCHVTGPKVKVEKDGAVLNGGVQCESCHGRAAAHSADPKVKAGLMKKPSESMCTACHNSSSPRFKGFVYAAMIGLSHPGLSK